MAYATRLILLQAFGGLAILKIPRAERGIIPIRHSVIRHSPAPSSPRAPLFYKKFAFYAILGLTCQKNAIESARRARAVQHQPTKRDMKTLAIILSLSAFTAMGNSLPPTPETPASVQA